MFKSFIPAFAGSVASETQVSGFRHVWKRAVSRPTAPKVAGATAADRHAGDMQSARRETRLLIEDVRQARPSAALAGMSGAWSPSERMRDVAACQRA